MKFYTYLWLRRDGTPYYVGKGTGRRATINYGHSVHRPKDASRIFIQYWESEIKALEIERWYVTFYGRKDLGTGILHNHTDGGEGPFNFSEERLKKMSERLLGKPSLRKGVKLSDETKAKIGRAHLGMIPSEEARINMSKAQLERKHSEFTKEKIADSNRRRKYSEKT